jgi:hypothetical protein
MKLSRTLLAVGLLAAAACSDIPTGGVRSTGAPSRLVVNRVDVAPATVVQGSTAQLTATAYDANNNPTSYSGSITWSSASPSVASVNSSGVVTGNAPGTATVFATIEGVVGSATVTVAGVYTQHQYVQCYYLQTDVVWVDESVYEREVVEYPNSTVVTVQPHLITYHTYDVGPYMGGALPCGTYDANGNWY